MGPIEAELRERAAGGQFGKLRLKHDAFIVMVDAMISLFDQWYWDGFTPYPSVATSKHWLDIMSEAIEAAESLNL